MHWDEILQWSQKGFIACCALALQLTVMLAVRQEARELKLKAIQAPCITASGAANSQPGSMRVSNCDK